VSTQLEGSMFESLGLGSEAESTYLHLVHHGPSTIYQLTSQLGQSASTLVPVIDELRQLGLIYTTARPGDPVVAVPLAVGADHLIVQRERELDRIRHSATLLEAQIATQAGRREPDLVEIITDREDVIRQAKLLHACVEERLRLLIRVPGVANVLLPDIMDQLPARDLRCQLVFDDCCRANNATVDTLCARLGSSVQTRLAVWLPATLTLVDHSAALVPLSTHAACAEQAMLVRGGALLHALEGLFESVWQAAAPLALTPSHASDASGAIDVSGAIDGGASDAIDEQDRALLALLVSGLTDDAAGARLSMSRRTVARRVQRLMTAAGARSRIQLGWWARQRRWL
jgi:predicted transcriptional regulator